MSVRIRLEAVSAADLDACEAALRSVLDIGPASRDFPNRYDGGRRRYLEARGPVARQEVTS